MASEERLRELEEKYEGYTVYDNQGSKIGKVDDLFVDEKDHEEYIGVKLGLLGRKSTLIPTEIVRVNENDRTIEVAESKDHVKDAPSFDDDEDVTADYEERIRSHFGLEPLQQGGSGSSYGAATSTAAGGAAGATAAGSGSSDHDEDRTSGSSGYASDSGERESSSETYADDRETSRETYSDDRETSSGTDSGYEGSQDSGSSSTGRAETSEGSSSSGTGYYEQAGGTGDTEERRETSGTSGTSGGSGEGSSGSSGSQPGTTRQTEETETFQEGGRTKIRRRVIREEVVDADDQGSGS
ncbi:MAG TPA: PRC-barrel domain-containing protein [Rubrobacter sp.]|nr:PRC-barrel domain-containing protein [Rubrobacter sp.]